MPDEAQTSFKRFGHTEKPPLTCNCRSRPAGVRKPSTGAFSPPSTQEAIVIHMQENQQFDTQKRIGARAAQYVALELAWRYAIGYQEPPSKVFMRAWLNRAAGDWKIVCDCIQAAGERQVDDPQDWVWRQLKHAFPPVQRWVVSAPGNA